MNEIEYLRSLFELEPYSGHLYFKERANDPEFNTRWAGSCVRPEIRGKHLYVRHKGKRHKLAVIIWALHYGDWNPDVYHANGDTMDYHLGNLRAPGRLVDLSWILSKR